MSGGPRVLVVGGGLVGLSCAVFLAWHGVRCVLVERHAGLLSHPRQRSLSIRSMESYRQVGLEPALLADRLHLPGPADYVSVRADSLAGRHEAVALHVDVAAGADLSPCAGLPIDQDRVERLLCRRAVELGARVRFGVELTDLRQDRHHVSGVLRVAGAEPEPVECDYLVAADGADSPIRHALGVASTDSGGERRMLTALVAADLRPALAGRTVDMAYLSRPRPGTFLMSLGRDAHRWVFGTVDEAGDDVGTCVTLVRQAVGVPDLPVTLLPQLPGSDRRVMRFRVGASVADRYRVGRVFLAGDAAHVMPPTGGFGGSTGVEDARNLAWKLATVALGRAGDGLLDSYEAERRPAATAALAQATARAGHRFGSGGGATEPIVDRNDVLLGFGYRSNAVVTGRPPPVVSPAASLTGRPGTRAPHVWLADGRSTVDLFGDRFVLLTAGDALGWRRVTRRAPVPVDVHGCGGEVAGVYRLGSSEGVLVRPDGVVAWRGDRPEPEVFSAVLARVLSLPAPVSSP
ncbi:2-polyprenyl-6-methoxyphenol hydroxylase-like FAD-dependent oxidoreductase [Stackebrandtia albiflava]|uniref:2-polyprenyl-6-methoxyphenol hydroxylase-like FAD-dependent oxidoreductase n=1 Tax=Stackebrandtia albiflava TaxID=406432 RepID=A0A562VDU5_9ACTN|nr:FAD-dependent monooxygenase [Stackebrandtia albiflava]TWJ16032.1 2-polyprenyl-6-methoxyphenol hydroxylase-like FAD-dependent oxidoreductase [Stackebrandtia albiflava]